MKTITGFGSTITRAAIVAVMGAALFAFGGVAHASAANHSSHKNKTGNLKIAAPTEIGGVLLPPGKYEVKAVNSADGAAIEFARWIENPNAQEGLPPWEREVVATVKASPQMLETATRDTGLLLAPADNSKAVGLTIRGDNVEYMIGQ